MDSMLKTAKNHKWLYGFLMKTLLIMKVFVTISLISILIICLYSCKEEQSYSERYQGDFAMVTTNMKLRMNPDTSAKLLEIVQSGETVTYLGERSENTLELEWSDGTKKEFWYKVQTDRGSNVTGWIYGAGLEFNIDSVKQAKIDLLNRSLGGSYHNLKSIDACDFRQDFEVRRSQVIRIRNWKQLGLERPTNFSIFANDRSIDDEPIWYIRPVNYSNPLLFGIIVYVDSYMGGFRLINYNIDGSIHKMMPFAHCDGDSYEHWIMSVEILSEDKFKFNYDVTGNENADGSLELLKGQYTLEMTPSGEFTKTNIKEKVYSSRPTY